MAANSAEFVSFATSSNVAAATKWLESASLEDGLSACLALLVKSKASLEALSKGKDLPRWGKAQFCIDFVSSGKMPQDMYSIGAKGHQTARLFYLKAFEGAHKVKLDTLWPKRDAVCQSTWFYPEYFNPYRSRRERVALLAKAHSDLGPFEDAQTNLWSLGGKYTYSFARQGTKPVNRATTCMLFARAVLHAAGFNVISDRTFKSQGPQLPSGLDYELKPFGGWVPSGDSIPCPLPGDIVQILGRDFPGGGNPYGSAHVAIVLSASSTEWTVVQGGGGDHRTLTKPRTLVPTPDAVAKKKYGSWCFKEDLDPVTGVGFSRPIVGWWNIDALGGGRWMPDC